jgi:hypothetical protein
MADEDYDVDDLDDLEDDDFPLEDEDDAAEDAALDASPDLADATTICGGDAELGQMLIDLVMRLKQ